MCLLREGLEYAILRRSFSGSASHLPQIFRQPIKSLGTVHVAPHSKQRIFLKSVKTVSRSSVCTGDFFLSEKPCRLGYPNSDARTL